MEVPVRIEQNGHWHTLKIEPGEREFTAGAPLGLKISYKSIVDITEKGNVLTLSLKGEKVPQLRIASVEQVLSALKKLFVMNCSAYRLSAFFLSPAIRGGVLVTKATWEKGAIAVLKTGIWFVSQNKQISIPLEDVTGIEMTKREVQGKQMDVVKIDHLEGQELTTSFVLCPVSTLQVLFNYLQESTKDKTVKDGEIDPLASQVAVLVYSGMDSGSIEKMLSLAPPELDRIIDTLLNAGIAEVVRVRKEIQLTPKGVKYISDALKSPQN